MDLIDKAVFVASNMLSMKRRTAAVKKYHLMRRGDLLQRRRDAMQGLQFPPGLPYLRDGYSVDQSRSLPGLEQVLQDAKAIVNENRVVPPKSKDYLINHLTAEDLRKHASFLDFACSDAMVAIASQYLGFVPVLSVVELWKSNRGDVPEIGSQLFHLDNADDKQVKVFVYLHDVDLDTGPLAFLPASTSRKVAESLDYGKVKGVERLTDDQVFAVAPKEDLLVGVYPEGTAMFVDTISCFHYGSRRNVKPRYVLMLQYLSPCRADFRAPSMKQWVRDDDTEVRKFLLDPDYRGQKFTVR